jgi:hypothetical protein
MSLCQLNKHWLVNAIRTCSFQHSVHVYRSRRNGPYDALVQCYSYTSRYNYIHLWPLQYSWISLHVQTIDRHDLHSHRYVRSQHAHVAHMFIVAFSSPTSSIFFACLHRSVKYNISSCKRALAAYLSDRCQTSSSCAAENARAHSTRPPTKKLEPISLSISDVSRLLLFCSLERANGSFVNYRRDQSHVLVIVLLVFIVHVFCSFGVEVTTSIEERLSLDRFIVLVCIWVRFRPMFCRLLDSSCSSSVRVNQRKQIRFVWCNNNVDDTCSTHELMLMNGTSNGKCMAMTMASTHTRASNITLISVHVRGYSLEEQPHSSAMFSIIVELLLSVSGVDVTRQW